MYLHKENRELFKDAILLASQRLKVSEIIVEKDYYVTMLLKELAKADYPAVFKGGTSLSKAYHVIDRFSEDIDIAFTEHLGESKRKKLKYNILKPIGDKLGLEIRNWKYIESDKNLNHYDFYYESVMEEGAANSILPYVKIETSLLSYAFPVEEREITNYLCGALSEAEMEIVEEYDLKPFPMLVQALSRTLIDKIYALCDYYLVNKPYRNARHLYDIYKLAPYVVVDEAFRDLVTEVRIHRMALPEGIAPAARKNVDIKLLINQLCDEDFYKEDYTETTVRLISDKIDYEMVKEFYREFSEKLF